MRNEINFSHVKCVRNFNHIKHDICEDATITLEQFFTCCKLSLIENAFSNNRVIILKFLDG